MLSIQNVLVAFDAQEGSQPVLDRAIELACRAPSHVLHIVAVLDGRAGSAVLPPTGDVDYRYAGEVQAELARIVEAELRRRGATQAVHYFVHARIGKPADEILQMAREIGADMILVGSSGVSGVKRMMLGSVSERVVREAGCPVIVARPKTYPDVARLDVVEVEPEGTHRALPHRYEYQGNIATKRPLDRPLYSTAAPRCEPARSGARRRRARRAIRWRVTSDGGRHPGRCVAAWRGAVGSRRRRADRGAVASGRRSIPPGGPALASEEVRDPHRPGLGDRGAAGELEARPAPLEERVWRDSGVPTPVALHAASTQQLPRDIDSRGSMQGRPPAGGGAARRVRSSGPGCSRGSRSPSSSPRWRRRRSPAATSTPRSSCSGAACSSSAPAPGSCGSPAIATATPIGAPSSAPC
ncbi:MAG: universal stress protein [Kofleriaceae bacterium]